MKKRKLIRLGIVVISATILAGGWWFFQPAPFLPFDSPPAGSPQIAHAEGSGDACTGCHARADIISTSLGCKVCHTDSLNTPDSFLESFTDMDILHHDSYFLLNPCPNNAVDCFCGSNGGCADMFTGCDGTGAACDTPETPRLASCTVCHTGMATQAQTVMKPTPGHSLCQASDCHQDQSHA